MSSKRIVRAVLAGNPNSGKSTLFNNITGARQHVGNYPGVTVERYEGIRAYQDVTFNLTDLPGSYSLSAFSDEERVARDILEEKEYDVIVNIVDASNLERNLYLTLQLKELGVPLIVVLNMIDVARLRGVHIDTAALSQQLNVPVIEAVGFEPESVPRVLDAIIQSADGGVVSSDSPADILYGEILERVLSEFQNELLASNSEQETSLCRWTALKLLERDDALWEKWKCEQTEEITSKYEREIERQTGFTPPVAFAAARYDAISRICIESVKSAISVGVSASDKIDAVLTSRLWGIPIFLFLMYLVFQLTFTLGAYPMEWIETGFAALGDWISSFWSEGSDSLLKSLIVNGIIAGVGGVIVFLPNILLLFLAISLLEDSGYMARAAYLTDRYMHLLGLHGKSFIPMLIGFGCSVPAIMATRTLSSRKERIITMFIIPLMSCGARLPIYALLIPAFFPLQWQAPIMWGLYCLGILVAIILAKILGLFIIKEDDVPFIIELPPYHFPTFRTVGIHTLERGWLYLKKAGTIILGVSIVLWAMTTFPRLSEAQKEGFEAQRAAVSVNTRLSDQDRKLQITEIDNREAEEQLVNSCAGKIGHMLEPALKPMGFDWKIGTALIGAIAAKEAFVSQMGIVYSVGQSDEESQPLRETIAQHYPPIVGLGIMIFCLLSAPCMATFAVMAREAGSWKWAAAQWITLTGIAWVIVTIMFKLGCYFQWGI